MATVLFNWGVVGQYHFYSLEFNVTHELVDGHVYTEPGFYFTGYNVVFEYTGVCDGIEVSGASWTRIGLEDCEWIGDSTFDPTFILSPPPTTIGDPTYIPCPSPVVTGDPTSIPSLSPATGTVDPSPSPTTTSLAVTRFPMVAIWMLLTGIRY